MANWLERAKSEIPQSAGGVTAKTDERNPTAVTAVPQLNLAKNHAWCPGFPLVVLGF